MKKKSIVLIIVLILILFGLIFAFLKFIYNPFTSTPPQNNLSNSTLTNQTKTYCTSGSRNAQVCSEIYAPVCGYPSMQTFSSSCFACMNQNVIYYIRGPCA